MIGPRAIPAVGVAAPQRLPALRAGREQLLRGLEEQTQLNRLLDDRVSAHDAGGFNAAGRFGKKDRADHRLEGDPFGQEVPRLAAVQVEIQHEHIGLRHFRGAERLGLAVS